MAKCSGKPGYSRINSHTPSCASILLKRSQIQGPWIELCLICSCCISAWDKTHSDLLGYTQFRGLQKSYYAFHLKTIPGTRFSVSAAVPYSLSAAYRQLLPLNEMSFIHPCMGALRIYLAQCQCTTIQGKPREMIEARGNSYFHPRFPS